MAIRDSPRPHTSNSGYQSEQLRASRVTSIDRMMPTSHTLKIGGRVVYRVADLECWADLGQRTSTADPGTGTVLPPKQYAR